MACGTTSRRRTSLAWLALPRALTDPLGAAKELVQFAIESGGRDNITVVLAPFPPAPPAPQDVYLAQDAYPPAHGHPTPPTTSPES